MDIDSKDHLIAENSKPISESPPRRKRGRIAKACIRCRIAKAKCVYSKGNTQCNKCLSKDYDCVSLLPGQSFEEGLEEYNLLRSRKSSTSLRTNRSNSVVSTSFQSNASASSDASTSLTLAEATAAAAAEAARAGANVDSLSDHTAEPNEITDHGTEYTTDTFDCGSTSSSEHSAKHGSLPEIYSQPTSVNQKISPQLRKNSMIMFKQNIWQTPQVSHHTKAHMHSEASPSRISSAHYTPNRTHPIRKRSQNQLTPHRSQRSASKLSDQQISPVMRQHNLSPHKTSPQFSPHTTPHQMNTKQLSQQLTPHQLTSQQINQMTPSLQLTPSLIESGEMTPSQLTSEDMTPGYISTPGEERRLVNFRPIEALETPNFLYNNARLDLQVANQYRYAQQAIDQHADGVLFESQPLNRQFNHQFCQSMDQFNHSVDQQQFDIHFDTQRFGFQQSHNLRQLDLRPVDKQLERHCDFVFGPGIHSEGEAGYDYTGYLDQDEPLKMNVLQHLENDLQMNSHNHTEGYDVAENHELMQPTFKQQQALYGYSLPNESETVGELFEDQQLRHFS